MNFLYFLLYFLLFNFTNIYYSNNNCSNSNTPNFVVKKESTKGKSVSKTEFKEKIGVEIKNVLHQCAQLNKQLGEMQIELSTMQKQLFDKVEELIENKRPFKKASRQQLNQTLKVVQSVNTKLHVQADVMKDVKSQINKDVCLSLDTRRKASNSG